MDRRTTVAGMQTRRGASAFDGGSGSPLASVVLYRVIS
jgi:hypothetical protein